MAAGSESLFFQSVSSAWDTRVRTSSRLRPFSYFLRRCSMLANSLRVSILTSCSNVVGSASTDTLLFLACTRKLPQVVEGVTIPHGCSTTATIITHQLAAGLLDIRLCGLDECNTQLGPLLIHQLVVSFLYLCEGRQQRLAQVSTAEHSGSATQRHSTDRGRLCPHGDQMTCPGEPTQTAAAQHRATSATGVSANHKPPLVASHAHVTTRTLRYLSLTSSCVASVVSMRTSKGFRLIHL